MTLSDPLRRVEQARNELSKAVSAAAAWDDAQRHEFETQRIVPLTQAAAQLDRALQRAAEQVASAQQLLA